MTESIVVFGNCQAESIGDAFRGLRQFADADYLYVRSFNISPEEIDAALSPAVTEKCTILLEQIMPQVSLDEKHHFPNARRVGFPSLDLNLLWPLRAEEKRAHPEPPAFPFGRYSYGDRVINEIVKKGLEGEEAWQYYEQRSAGLIPDMQRMIKVEEARWLHAESGVEIRMSDLIFPRIATERLFWTYNHPSRLTLCYLGGRILQQLGLAPNDDEAARDMMLDVLTWEFGIDYQQPIHPVVAKQLGLEWWRNDLIYRRGDSYWDYTTFMKNQIAWA